MCKAPEFVHSLYKERYARLRIGRWLIEARFPAGASTIGDRPGPIRNLKYRSLNFFEKPQPNIHRSDADD